MVVRGSVRQLGMPETPEASTPSQNMLLLHSAVELAEKPEVRRQPPSALVRSTRYFFRSSRRLNRSRRLHPLRFRFPPRQSYSAIPRLLHKIASNLFIV